MQRSTEEVLEYMWFEYKHFCVRNNIEHLEREEYISTVLEYYSLQLEANNKDDAFNKCFAIKVGKELFFPIRGRESKTYYHLETLLLTLNPNFRQYWRQPYFKMIVQQYPDHKITHTAIQFIDTYKRRLFPKENNSPVIDFPMKVLTAFYEQCAMQVVSFESSNDAFIFLQILLEEEGFEELGSYCDVRYQTELYIAYHYAEKKKVVLDEHVITCYYFPGGIDFTQSFELNFGRDNFI